MSSVSTENHLVKAIVEQYVTFPVLLTEKEFFEVRHEVLGVGHCGVKI